MLFLLFLISIGSFFGMEEFKITVTRNSIFKILTTIFIFLCVNDESDLNKYVFIMSLGNLMSQLILWTSLPKFVKFKFVNLNSALKHLKPNLKLFIPVVATSVYTLMDKIMLGNMTNMNFVGLYENADKIKNILMGFITALGTVMLPKMTKLISQGNNKLAEKYLYNSLKYMLLISFAMGVGLAAISKEFVVIFFGEEFRKSYYIMIILSISMIFIAWANVIRTQKLIPENLDNVYINSTITGAVINFIFNIILIRYLNAIGAAIATLIAECSVAVYQTIYVRNEMKNIKKMTKTIMIYFIASIIMFVVIRIIGKNMGETLLTVLMEVIAGAVIYLTIVLSFLIKEKDELILTILNKFKKLRHL